MCSEKRRPGKFQHRNLHDKQSPVRLFVFHSNLVGKGTCVSILCIMDIKGAAASLGGSLVGPCSTSVGALDGVIEEHLSRADEMSVLLDSTRVELSSALDAAFPALAKSTAELQSLFAVIDAAEAAVQRVHSAANAANERLEVLQKAADAKLFEPTIGSAISGAARSLMASVSASLRPPSLFGGSSEAGAAAGGSASSSSKLGGLFGFGRSKATGAAPAAEVTAAPGTGASPATAGRRAIDAPLVLPAWNAASAAVSSSAEVSALAAHVGDVSSILTASAAAADAARDAAAATAEHGADLHGAGAGLADGTASAAHANAEAEAAAAALSGPDGGHQHHHDDDRAAGTASPLGAAQDSASCSGEDGDHAHTFAAESDHDSTGGAAAVAASSPAPMAVRAKAIAAGEDDEEEDDEDD